jgi:hypothetical protein
LLKFDDVDTSETKWLETLDNSTNDIVAKLGLPHQTDANHWEWKVKVGENVYSIYNWRREDGEFDEFIKSDWYVAGWDGKTAKADIKALKKYLTSKGTSTLCNLGQPSSYEDENDSLEVNLDDIM